MLTIEVSIYLHDGNGNRVPADASDIERRLTGREWRDLEDHLANAANDWIEAQGHDRLAAKVA